MAILGQNHPHLRGNFPNSSTKIQCGTLIDVFPEFHADLSSYKKQLRCTRYKKTPTFFAATLRLFGPGRQNFNTWDLTSACKILSGLLSFAGIIREKPILSKYILRCHAWQGTTRRVAIIR